MSRATTHPVGKLSKSDIGPAVELFIRRYPSAPRPDAAHSSVQRNFILLKNSAGTVAVATPDGDFLSRIGGAEYDDGGEE